MPNNNLLLEALKSALRQRNLHYADLAKELDLSESSIKRLFSTGNLSLKRLQKICDWAGIDESELLALATEQQNKQQQLSDLQEQALVDDIKLLLIAFLLINHWQFEDIIAEYAIDELEGIRLLASLDRLGIIDLLPANKVRMRLARGFQWRSEGPLQRFFERHVQSEFFQSQFTAEGEQRLFLTGTLSAQSVDIIQQRLQRVAQEFEVLVSEDRRLSNHTRQGMTVIMAMRPWELSLFERLKRS